MRVAGEEGAESLPHHYAILPCPKEEASQSEFNKHLADAHISPLWYPEGEHDYVERILQLLME